MTTSSSPSGTSASSMPRPIISGLSVGSWLCRHRARIAILALAKVMMRLPPPCFTASSSNQGSQARSTTLLTCAVRWPSRIKGPSTLPLYSAMFFSLRVFSCHPEVRLWRQRSQ